MEILTTVCVVLLCSAQYVLTSPTVHINNSQITGEHVYLLGHKLNQYLSVPYAQPPVGTLRFKKPVPYLNYPPDVKADTDPPGCPQYTENDVNFYVNTTYQSEDCLYLNIWTPADASPTNKKAVFYWIFGGGFQEGGIRNKYFSGKPLSALGDIVVVTVNYRVGPIGFLYSGTDDAPGNAGLWDILEGLRWVNKNIEAFGGDPNRITIAGESSGAFCVGLLTVSPQAKGLYTRLIVESGPVFNRVMDNNTMNIALSERLAKVVGCANDSSTIYSDPKKVVQCLRGVDPVTLSKVVYKFSPNGFGYFPQWGDELLPKNPRPEILAGNFSCADMLVGNNKDEGPLFLTMGNPDLFGFFGQKNPHVSRTVGVATIKGTIAGFPDPDSIVNYYIPPNLTQDTNYRIRHQTYTGVGDTFVLCPVVYYAEKCAEQSRKVYYYLFNHRPSNTPYAKWCGVPHTAEVQFVFGQPILHPEEYEPSEVLLSRQVIDIWSSFVKHGKPSIPWPLYSKEDPLLKYIGPEYATEENGVKGIHHKNCNFLRPFY